VFLRLLFFILFVIPVFSHSAVIVKVKGNRCFVHLEGAAASVGDHLEALDLFGKPRGIVRLDKVKNGKAIATIVDGTVGVNWLLEHTNQTKLEYVETRGSLPKNKIGLLGSGSWIIMKKDIRRIERYNGWKVGGSIFFDWFFQRFFSLNIATGLNYFMINNDTSTFSQSSGPLRMTGFPYLQLSLKFHLPISERIKVWISVGGNVSKWNDISNDNYQIVPKDEFKFQPSGLVKLGMNINIPNTKYTVPVSIGYARVQWGGKWFEEYVLGRKPNPDRPTLEISEIIFQVGVSQPI